MKLSDFDYILPEELIATHANKNRDTSKLLISNETITDGVFTDILNLINPNDVLVLNDTKVLPARMQGSCKGANAEITLLKKTSDDNWIALAKPGKKMIVGEKFIISNDFHADIISKDINGEIILKFNKTDHEFLDQIHQHGRMPLPPYIEKKRVADDSDAATYQTVYANDSKELSVAAPTAGLHFTTDLIDKLKQKGVTIAFVTLHVGAGTFLPVRTENILEHKMHSEVYEIDNQTAEKINKARGSGGRVIAVGTTALRVIETVANEKGELNAQTGETNIFIYPGYKFKIVDVLITNFHLPKSTLFMLVSAFVGREKALEIYSHAIAKKYHFFSYGDASFLVRGK